MSSCRVSFPCCVKKIAAEVPVVRLLNIYCSYHGHHLSEWPSLARETLSEPWQRPFLPDADLCLSTASIAMGHAALKGAHSHPALCGARELITLLHGSTAHPAGPSMMDLRLGLPIEFVCYHGTSTGGRSIRAVDHRVHYRLQRCHHERRQSDCQDDLIQGTRRRR
jgi:hypothetical protein